MSTRSVRRPSQELAAWVGALTVAAGLSLPSSLPGAAAGSQEARSLAGGAQTVSSVPVALVPSAAEPSPALLRPDCILFRVPDAREVAAVLRGVSSAHADAEITVGWAGVDPREPRVVAVCER